jgi:hypothetical protein
MSLENPSLIPVERVEQAILVIRGQKVMLDADLAILYGVTTSVLNQAVKRNAERFPSDFMFQLTEPEKVKVVTICGHLARMKYSPARPYAFTEHGALMLASVLKTPRAVETSIQIIRVFIRLREMLATHKDLARQLDEMEQKYDKQFAIVFDAVRALMEAPEPPKKRIGFNAKERVTRYKSERKQAQISAES